MYKKNKMFDLPYVRIEIRQSTMIPQQIGLFSLRKVSGGEVLIDASVYSDIHLLPKESFDSLDQITKQKILGFCPSGPDGFDIPTDLNCISIAWYMNHSCNPNIGFNDSYDFVAIRNIDEGEELSWDYGYDEHNPDFKMNCLCGSEKCRKIITGNDWKILMKDGGKYPFFSPKLKEFINIQKNK